MAEQFSRVELHAIMELARWYILDEEAEEHPDSMGLIVAKAVREKAKALHERPAS